MKYWSLFSGIGGFDLGFDRDGMEQEAEDDDLEDDEYGASVPTKYALDRAVSLLAQAYQAVRNISPLAAVTTTSYEGGIRVQWMYPSANLRLIIPGNRNGQEYIYFEADDEYGTEDVSGQNLTKRLMWLQRLE